MGELVRNQNPPLQKTTAKNPRWYIRPYVDRLQPDGTAKRQRERIYLGSCGDVDRKSAGVQRAEVLRRINNGSYVLQSQINFGEFLDLFEKKFVEAKDNLAASTQAKYAAHLKNHIRQRSAIWQLVRSPRCELTIGWKRRPMLDCPGQLVAISAI